MKNIIYFIVFFLCLSACKKEEANSSLKALAGTWKGNYSSPPDMPNEGLLQAWELKENGEITNAIYQLINNISKAVATTDLSNLVNQKLIQKVGTTGKGTKYRLPSKGL